MDFIRPRKEEVFDEKEGKWDGKAKDYFAWLKSTRQKIRSEGKGDLIQQNYYEIEKPDVAMAVIERLNNGGYKAKILKRADVQEVIKNAREEIKLWTENAEKVKLAGLYVMGILEGTMSAQAWHKTQKIQDDEKISERKRVLAIFELFRQLNEKYNANSVEEIQSGVRAMGRCRSRQDVEMMMTQLETAQMALETIPAAVIMRGGNKEEQAHKMTDRQMNEHMLIRLPQKSMWEQLKAEVVARDADTVNGAFTTEELKGRMETFLSTYTMSWEEKEEEAKWKRERENDKTKKVKVEQSTKGKHEGGDKTGTAQVNSSIRRGSSEVRDCIHFKHNNCKNGDNCSFKHNESTRVMQPVGKKGDNQKGDKKVTKKMVVNMTTKVEDKGECIKRKRDSGSETEKAQIAILEGMLKTLRQSQKAENSGEEFMTDSDLD